MSRKSYEKKQLYENTYIIVETMEIHRLLRDIPRNYLNKKLFSLSIITNLSVPIFIYKIFQIAIINKQKNTSINKTTSNLSSFVSEICSSKN